MQLTTEQAAKRLMVTPSKFAVLTKRHKFRPTYSWVDSDGRQIQIWSEDAVECIRKAEKALHPKPPRIVDGMLPLDEAARAWGWGGWRQSRERLLQQARDGELFSYARNRSLAAHKIGGRWYVNKDEFERHCRQREEHAAAEKRERERNAAEWERTRPERERRWAEAEEQAAKARKEAEQQFRERVARREFTDFERERGFAALVMGRPGLHKVELWACCACGSEASVKHAYHPCRCHLCEDWFGCRDDSGSWSETIVTCSACGQSRRWRD
jgi:hypothetical protein